MGMRRARGRRSHLKAALDALAAEDSGAGCRLYHVRGEARPLVIKIIEKASPKRRARRGRGSRGARREDEDEDEELGRQFELFLRERAVRKQALGHWFYAWLRATLERLEERTEASVTSSGCSSGLAPPPPRELEDEGSYQGYKRVIEAIDGRIVDEILDDEMRSERVAPAAGPVRRAFVSWLAKARVRQAWRKEIAGGIQRGMVRRSGVEKRVARVRKAEGDSEVEVSEMRGASDVMDLSSIVVRVEQPAVSVEEKMIEEEFREIERVVEKDEEPVRVAVAGKNASEERRRRSSEFEFMSSESSKVENEDFIHIDVSESDASNQQENAGKTENIQEEERKREHENEQGMGVEENVAPVQEEPMHEEEHVSDEISSSPGDGQVSDEQLNVLSSQEEESATEPQRREYSSSSHEEEHLVSLGEQPVLVSGDEILAGNREDQIPSDHTEDKLSEASQGDGIEVTHNDEHLSPNGDAPVTVSSVEEEPSESQQLPQGDAKSNELAEEEDIDLDFLSDEPEKETPPASAKTETAPASVDDNTSDVDVLIEGPSDEDEPPPVAVSSSSSGDVDVQIEALSDEDEPPPVVVSSSSSGDVEVVNSSSDDQDEQPPPAKEVHTVQDEIFADISSSSSEEEVAPSKLSKAEPANVVPEIPKDLLEEVKKQNEPPKPPSIASPGLGVKPMPRVPGSSTSTLLQRLSGMSERRESREREYIRKFFMESLFNTIKEKKAKGQFYPMIEVPNTVQKPFNISQECSDLIVDLMNETVDSTNLDEFTYETFLDLIEKLLNSGGQWTLKQRLTFPESIAAKKVQVDEHEQVAGLLELADMITERQLQCVLCL